MNNNMSRMNNNRELQKRSTMRSPKELTRADILATATRFRWLRKMPKWTVIVDNRELPARPLVLEAAGVPPNDPTNSHQAIAILKDRGFTVRYQGEIIRNEDSDPILQPVTD